MSGLKGVRRVASVVAPIMVRAAITPDEWTALRKLALDRKTTTQSLVADALRKTYNLEGAR